MQHTKPTNEENVWELCEAKAYDKNVHVALLKLQHLRNEKKVNLTYYKREKNIPNTD